ncbi:MAG: hypothetical protein PHZ23_16210 [Acidiphilium sp.]|nr:hypothetical protein [Acidiphilium sp.]
MSSTTALPMITAVTEAMTDLKYHSGDVTTKFLTELHAKGYQIVALDTPLPAVAELRGSDDGVQPLCSPAPGYVA